MKCRKGDRILLDSGKWCTVVKGTNIENGWVEVIERFPEIGWVQKTYHHATEIVGIKNWMKEKD